MQKSLLSISIFCLFIFLYACSKDETSTSLQDGSIARSRIAWDYTSLQKLGEDGGYGGYPRMIRLSTNALVLVYEYKQNVVLRKSHDDGLTWTSPQIVFEKFKLSKGGKSVVINISNPEIIALKNGDLLLACNYRPQEADFAPFTIEVKRSVDNGETWSEAIHLYGTETQFGNGCWEPSFLELPDGTVQVYFANENPYTNSNEQEISMMWSADNGKTWSDTVKTISFRKDFRDGMPVACIVNDEIVVSIEDNADGQFKPYTVRTKIADNWQHAVLEHSPQRSYALKDTVPSSLYMGAPYLIKLPSGETLLSYQSTRDRTTEWEHATMEVAIGDREAKNFIVCDNPFDVPLINEAKWSSISLFNEQTVVALAASNLDGGNISPWMKKGYIIPQNIPVNTSNYPIFIGSKGSAQLKSKVLEEEKRISIECIVRDNNVTDDGARSGVYFYISKNTKDIYKIWSSYNGDIACWKYEKDQWVVADSKQFYITSNPTIDGYQLKIAWEKSKNIRIGLALSALDDEGKEYVEHLAGSTETDTETWLTIY